MLHLSDRRRSLGQTFVTGVAVTLSVRSQQRDHYSKTFQQATKTLLNVSPRNIFLVWTMVSIGVHEPAPADAAERSGLLALRMRTMPIHSSLRDRVPAVESARVRRRRARERSGVALVVALLLTLALSAIGASLLMLANTETYASMNYRMMSQARYGAEAGVLRAVNHLTQTRTQTPGLVGDPLANYDMTVSPVTYNGQPVVLSADPDQGVELSRTRPRRRRFNAAVQGTLDGRPDGAYGAYATLVSMRTIMEYGATAPTRHPDVAHHRRPVRLAARGRRRLK